MQRVFRLRNNLESSEQTVKVTVTGAAGNIGYALCFMIGQGRLLGMNKNVHLCLLEIPQMQNALEGVAMELRDCALPLIKKISITTDQKEAFFKCDVALLVGARPRGPGMQRKDLLRANAKIFKSQAYFLDKFANSDCKICVVGNPANTNALIILANTSRIRKENITALTRLDQNRAVSQIALKTESLSRDVRNSIIWGNHSKTQFPDLQICEVIKNGVVSRVRDFVSTDWERNLFIPKIQKRGAEIIQKRSKSSAASAANAICDHVRTWLMGTEEGEIVSMAVNSDNNPYGIAKGLIFSFPVTCKNGSWKIVPNLPWDNFAQKMIRKTEQELLNEKKIALDYLNANQHKQQIYLFINEDIKIDTQIIQHQNIKSQKQFYKSNNGSEINFKIKRRKELRRSSFNTKPRTTQSKILITQLIRNIT